MAHATVATSPQLLDTAGSAPPQTPEKWSTPLPTPPLSPRKRKAPSRYGDYEDETSDDSEEDANISDGWNDEGNLSDHEDSSEDTSSEDETSSNDEDFDIDATTAETMKADFGQMSVQGQDSFDQDVWNLQGLLKLDPEKVYNIEDLEDDRILERALKLLYLSRFGARAALHPYRQVAFNGNGGTNSSVLQFGRTSTTIII